MCNIQYVGETKNSIQSRMAQHRYNIRNNINTNKETNTWIVKHFTHHGLSSFEATGLQHDSQWTQGQRKWQEREWIRRLATKYPQGLNAQT